MNCCKNKALQIGAKVLMMAAFICCMFYSTECFHQIFNSTGNSHNIELLFSRCDQTNNKTVSFKPTLYSIQKKVLTNKFYFSKINCLISCKILFKVKLTQNRLSASGVLPLAFFPSIKNFPSESAGQI